MSKKIRRNGRKQYQEQRMMEMKATASIRKGTEKSQAKHHFKKG